MTGSPDYRLKRRVTLIGALGNLLLALGKIVVGAIGQSQALIADGVHSLSDLLSDTLVLLAARFGSHDADAAHPYGHARFETVATVLIGLLLLLAAAGFIYDAVARLLHPAQLLTPGWPVLAAAGLSVLIKELLYRYTTRAARRLGSPLLAANAWHHRSDALSSVVVLIGVSGTLMGLAWFDAAAAIVVALMVGLVGARFIWQAVRELVDTGLERRELAQLRQHIDAVPGVRSHHGLRTRRMGGKVLIDVHVLVEPWISVSEGHRIANAVHANLMQRIADASDVLVHIDVEEESLPPEDAGLAPLRAQVLADLERHWADFPEWHARRRVLLHYRGARVDVELLLPIAALTPEALPQARARLHAATSALDYVGRVELTLGD